MERKFHDCCARICRAVIDEQSFAALDDSGGEADVGHETLPFVIRLRQEHLPTRPKDAAWVLQIEQENSGGIGPDAGFLLPPAIAVINLEPARTGSNRRSARADSPNVPGRAPTKKRLGATPRSQIRGRRRPHFRFCKGG